MHITRLTLKNIKSYRLAQFTFVRGVNSICGENGAGKSTVLEAIGYALFGHIPTKQADLLREGERSGRIELRFLADDGREYQITRSVGASNEYRLEDNDMGYILADGKAAVQNRLCQMLGLTPGISLSALFADAIGVPQGLHAAIFLESAQPRQSKFNPLLRVEEYRRAFEKLMEPIRYLKDLLVERGQRITELQTRTERIPALQQEIADLDTAIQENERRRPALLRLLDTLLQEETQLEEQLRRIGVLETKRAVAEKDRQSCEQNEDVAADQFGKSQGAFNDRHHASAGYHAYRQAEDKLNLLELERTTRDALTRDHSNAQNQASRMEGQVLAGQQQMKEARTSEARLAELAPAMEQLRESEIALNEQERRAARLEERRQQAKRALAAVEDLERELHELDGRQHSLSEREAEADLLPEVESEFQELTERLALAQAQLNHARDSRQEVEGGKCPFLKQECRNLSGEMGLTDYFDAEIDHWQKELRALSAKHKQVEIALTRARQATQMRAALPELQARRQKLVRDRSSALESLHALLREIEDLTEAPERLTQLEETISRLEATRQEYQRALAVASQRGDIQARLDTHLGKLAQLEKEIASIAEKLLRFERLDEQIKAARTCLVDHENDYRLFLRSEPLAEQLEDRRNQWQRAKEKLRQAKAAHLEACDQWERARSAYEPERYTSIRGSRSQTEQNIAVLDSRRESDRTKRTDDQRVLDELLNQLRELEHLRTESRRDEKVLVFLQYSRDLIAQAGPLVSHAMIGRISREARYLFSEIMNDPGSHLEIAQDYGISVERGGSRRDFRQLSGGEQMAAALAARLAILRHVSDIDLVFFDEPTANLDNERRSNLADQIMNLRDLSQIIVISHDDTFERITDHMIRVRKEDGESQVTIG